MMVFISLYDTAGILVGELLVLNGAS